jgi:hypothetical protein
MLFVDGKQQSWTDRLLDRISPEAPPPPPPAPPPVDQTAWEESVDSHKVNKLIVYEVGLIVFNEAQSASGSDSANDTIDGAFEKLAHVVINGDEKFGLKRPVTAGAIEPSAEALRNPAVRSAYDSSIGAARRAFLSGEDPTNGATHFKLMTNADRSPQRFSSMGKPRALKTQSGPFHNSYFKGGVPSRQVFLNTYEPD